MLDATVGQHRVVEGNSAEQFLEACALGSTDHVFSYSDIPDTRVIQAFQRIEAPVAVFLDSAVDTVEFLMRTHKMDATNAIRTSSLYFSALHDFVLSKAVYVVGPDAANLSFEAMVRGLSRVYQLKISDSQLATIINRLKSEPNPRQDANHETLTTEQERETIYHVLSPFESLLEPGEVMQTYWPRETFCTADQGGLPSSGPLDLTGRARVIFYGPYLNLPPGRWTATATFEVSDNETGNTLSMEISAGGVFLAKGQCELPPSGEYVCNIAFELEDPRAAIEVYFGITKGAIEGRLDVKGVEMRRL
jgi:hypothetical protein